MMLSENPSVYKSFLACPISGFMRFGRLELPQQFERFIRAIFTVLMEESDETFLALARERWGASIMQGDICTPLDFEEMRRCDLALQLRIFVNSESLAHHDSSWERGDGGRFD
jgi:hypothetical protein